MGHLLWIRGVDTVIGCTIALLVLLLTMPRRVAMRIPQALEGVLHAVATALELAARAETASDAALQARRDLQHRTIVLLQAYDAAIDSTPGHRDLAERSWPAVVATQRLAYRVLATFWSLERSEIGSAPEVAGALFGPDGAAAGQRGDRAAVRRRSRRNQARAASPGAGISRNGAEKPARLARGPARPRRAALRL